jgi:TRAP transporter TAXI family solute receptor
MRTRGLVAAGLTVALVAALLPPGRVEAQPLPRTVSLGTNPAGTVFYALASGFAKVIGGATPLQVSVQPYTGTSTLMPLANSGELDFSVVNAVDMGLAYQGPKLKVGGKNPFAHTPDVRLVMRGAPLLASLLVRKDSPIKTIYEVKGKRVTGEYPAHLAVWFNIYAFLANGGMSWNDVKVVPVPAVNDGVDALVQGRADVSMHALNSAKIREAEAAVGVRHLSLDCSPEGVERLKKAVPGYYPRWLKAGEAVAIVGDTCVNAYDIYVLTHKNATEQVVTTVLKAIWDNVDQLPPFHPVFKEWTRDRAVDPGVTLPYHPAAIRFYKERGVWTPPMDEAQKKLLALNP